MRKENMLSAFLLAAAALPGFGQGYLGCEYLTASTLKDENGGRYGSGDLLRLTGRYTIPISRRTDRRQRMKAWSATLSASYFRQGRSGQAAALCPDRVLNANVTLAHMGAVSERWSLLASAGCGIYAAPDEVRWRSILANAACIFAYRLRDNLSIGIGAGLTNSYGVPLVMPMGYLKWQTGGRYELTVDVANAPKVKVATQANERVRLELTVVEVDGLSAVTRRNGKQQIYSSTLLKSELTASVRISAKASLYAGAGSVWTRSCRTTDRNLKSFFKAFGNDADEYHFGTSLRCSVGLRFGF